MLQKPRDRHRVTEANFFEFIHRASGGSHRKNLVSGLSEAPGFTLFRAIAGNAIRAVALPQKLSSLRVETLPYRLALFEVRDQETRAE